MVFQDILFGLELSIQIFLAHLSRQAHKVSL